MFGLIFCLGFAASACAGAEEARRSFAIPAGHAEVTLEAFSEQANVSVVFPLQEVRGVPTQPIRGDFAPSEALEQLTTGTGLDVRRDEGTGAFVVRRGRSAALAADASHPDNPNPSAPASPQSMKSPHRLGVLGAWFALVLGVHSHAADASLGTIQGRVYNARSGEFVEHARVTAEGTAQESFTDSSGQYRLPGVPTGAVRIRAFFTGFEPVQTTVNVTAGGTTQYDINFGGEGRDVIKLSEFIVGASREMDGAAIAINEQRFAPNITHVVSAGEFGISADGSIGEFLKYLPGISVDYVGGTANTISLDGVPANNVPVTIAGFDLASTSSASTSRATELLQISIQNAARLEVLHSPTPETPGSALAGSINMVPRSAFERSRPLFTGSVYLMMRDNYRVFHKTEGPGRNATYKVQPGFDFSYIRPVNQRFGFTLSGSYSKQFLPQDTVQTSWAGVVQTTTGIVAPTAATQYPDTTPDRPYLTNYQLLDQTKFNWRSSLGATLDYKLSSYDTVSFSYQYGAFGSEYNGNALTWFVNRVEADNFTPTSTHGTVGRGEIRNTNGARWRDGHTHMPSLVFRHLGPIWRAEAGAGYSYSTNVLRDTSRGYFGGLTARRTNVTVSFDDIFYLRPRVITVTDGATGAPVNPADLSNYVITSGGSPQPRDSVDVKRSAYTNARREFEIAGVPLAVKAGLDVRQALRDMRGTNSSLNFVGADGRASTTVAGSDDNAAILLDQAVSQRVEPFGFGKIQWMSADKGWDLYQAHPTWFTADPAADYRNMVALSKHAQETISSAFIRGDVALFDRRLKLIGGLRVEQTNVKAEGPLNDATRNYQRDAAGHVVPGGNGRPLPITTDPLAAARLTVVDRGMHAEKEYLRLFPTLNASYSLRENLIARGAFYTSVGRPDYNQYAGGITLPDTENAPSPSNQITVNNVAIKAWSAKTTKLRLEYYFEKVGQVSVGAFRRDFKNFFGSTTFLPTPEFLSLYNLDPDIYGNYQVSTQYNLPSTVRMTGLEFDYKQALTFLPHWARGVQVFGNLTALRTTGPAAANFAGFVPRTYNWGISLNRERFNLRANWNYQGRRRLAEVTGRGIESGTFNWRNKRLNLDVQGEYYFYRRFSVFANLRNVNDATEDFEIAGPHTPPHAQFRRREDYGASWTFGVKGTF